MLMPNVMQGLSLEMFLVIVIGYIWFQSRKNLKTETLVAFFRLCSTLLLFLVIDIPVRISDLELVRFDSRLVFWLNAAYIGLETLTIYEWFIYFLTVENPNRLTRNKRLIATIPLDVTVILLIVSYKTSWLFYVDDQGMYQRGSLFFLQFLVPYSYLVASFVSTFIGYSRNKNRRILNITMSAFFTAATTSVLQVIFSGSFTHAGLCLVVILVYLEMFQEEVRKIAEMRSLSSLNGQLEEANQKLNETVRELEQSVANEKAANNAKNEFLSRMSHDIRTPLNGIMGIIEINDKHPEDVQLIAENRKRARVAANHLMSLVNDVLDMSKLTSDRFEFSHESFHISEIMTEVLSTGKSRASAAGVTFINENEGEDAEYPVTYGSSIHVTRALVSLVTSAVKYSHQDGIVRVKLEKVPVGSTQIKYRFTIVDEGIGMSKEFLNRIFEPFGHEKTDIKGAYEGSGLSMTLTKTLIEKMGGTITAESKIGEGTTFRVSLPFDIAREDTEASLEKNADIRGVRILVTEDNELNLDIAQSLLEDEGAIVDIAENGKIALEKFSSQPAGSYDVILMDCMMPVMDGYEATRAIRALERADAKKIPILAMTANAFAEDVQNCLNAGMNDHLAKPFEIEKVKQAIRKYLES